MTHKAISHKPKSLFHLDASLQKESINPEIQFNLFSFSLYFYAFPIVTYRKKITTLFSVAYSRISQRLFQNLHEHHDKTM
jgi:hypothetical protein